MFDLTENNDGTTWSLEHHELYDPPAALGNLSPLLSPSSKAYINNFIAVLQKEIEFVTKGSPQNEAYTRCLLNNILVCCVAEEKRFAQPAAQSVSSAAASTDHASRPTTPLPEPAHLVLRFETELKYPVHYKREARMLNGIADYTLWYNTDESMGTNLVVVEAKRRRWTSQAAGQVVAYMGELYFVEPYT